MSEIHWNEFNALKSALAREFEQLLNENKKLRTENARLQRIVDQQKELKKPDLFVGMDENDRIAFKQRVKGLIDKLDKHLATPKE